MKLTNKSLKRLLEGIIDDVMVNETVFEIDADDNDMQQKINKIKSDSSLYNDGEDKIQINTESVYRKSDILSLIQEAKNKKNLNDDYLKAIKKADRESEYDEKGPGWKAKDRPHKNKKKYDRKSNKKETLVDNINENVVILTKSEINKMILENKHNAKVYSKKDFIKEISEDMPVKEENENNPWAICSANISKKKNPKKHERCVKKVKKSTGYEK